MIVLLATPGSSLAGNHWALLGLENSVDPVLTYLSSAWPMWVLFFIGIGLGYLLRGRRKSPAPESETPDLVPAEDPDAPVEEERKSGKLIAELEGKLRVEQQLSGRQRQEMEALQHRLDSVRQQRDEKQERFETLSMTLEKASEQPGSSRSLAHARAPVIHLDELVQVERQHFESGLDWLRELEGRLSGDSRDLWNSAESVETIRGQTEAAFAGSESGELMDRVGVVDEHLRVFCQNIEGCLQRIATTKLRMESDEKKLEEAAEPIAEAEAALADLAASEESPDTPRLEAAFVQAQDRLSESRSAVASLENGIDQEIAELTGRIDWVVKDSPKNFLNALDELNTIEPPSDPEASQSFNEVWRHLSEARHILAGIQLPLDGSAFGESQHVSGKHRIIEAIENAITTMKSAKAAPAIAIVEKPAIADGHIAHLERQLALRESETARLDQKLKLTARELQKLREENEQLGAEFESSGLSAEPNGGNFVRRLLGLGPGSVSGDRHPDSGLEISGSATATSAVTLSEAREILSELKLVSTNGSGYESSEHSGKSEDENPADPSTGGEEPEPEPADADVDDAELRHLREHVTRQKIRIEELEETISELRKAGPDVSAESLAPRPVPLDESGRIAGEGILPGELVATTASEVVIFRGDDLAVWDSDFQGPGRQIATPLETLPDEVHYLRMKRLDTGDSVVIPISRSELLEGATGSGKGYGWSGKRERYFGSDHLGIYDESLPRDVETKFGAGGWGFGHIESIGSRQAYGWAGRQIGQTDFEISVGTEPFPLAKSGAEIEVPLAGELQTEAAVPAGGLIIFRSNNPAIWGENTYSGANCRSRELDDLPDDIAWLRIRCLPGGESVVLPVTKPELTRNDEGLIRGFNGSNELFYGARHLGAFDESLPQDVETRFTYGGWGFGHCPSGPENQACGWAGRKIDEDTVFEFTVYRTMPEIDELLDRVLEI